MVLNIELLLDKWDYLSTMHYGAEIVIVPEWPIGEQICEIISSRVVAVKEFRTGLRGGTSACCDEPVYFDIFYWQDQALTRLQDPQFGPAISFSIPRRQSDSQDNRPYRMVGTAEAMIWYNEVIYGVVDNMEYKYMQVHRHTLRRHKYLNRPAVRDDIMAGVWRQIRRNGQLDD